MRAPAPWCGVSHAVLHASLCTENFVLGFICVLQDRVVSTEPPEVQRFGMTMTQWDLYDSYMAEYERVQVQARVVPLWAQELVVMVLLCTSECPDDCT